MNSLSIRRITTTIAALLGGAALLAACGSATATGNTPPASSSTSTRSTTSTSTVAGTPFISAAFSTIIPDRWEDSSANICTGKQALMCQFTRSSTSNAAVAMISADPMPQPVADADLASALQKLVTDQGAQQVQTGSLKIGTDDAPAVTYSTSNAGYAPDQDEDLLVNHGGQTYRIHFQVETGPSNQFSTYAPAFQAVLSAWAWR